MIRARLGGPSLALLWLFGLLSTGVSAVDRDEQGDVPIERFHRVDDRLYRGAQPTEAGFRRLKELGVTTIINLRMEADAKRLNEQKIVETLGMRYVNIPVEDGNFFTRSRTIPDAAIRIFFEVIESADRGSVFVHCHRGADRTGAMVGFYRIVKFGWTGAQAFAEARKLGMRSWYQGLRRQVESFTPATLLAIRSAGP